jgi:hypothetical protein
MKIKVLEQKLNNKLNCIRFEASMVHENNEVLSGNMPYAYGKNLQWVISLVSMEVLETVSAFIINPDNHRDCNSLFRRLIAQDDFNE